MPRSTSAPGSGLIEQTMICPGSRRSSQLPPRSSSARRPASSSALVACSTSWPTMRWDRDAHVALDPQRVGRGAPAGRRRRDVDHVPAGCERHLGDELTAADLRVLAADAHDAVGGRDRPAHLDAVGAHRAAVVRLGQLQLDARARGRARRLAAGTQGEAGGEQEHEAAHAI